MTDYALAHKLYCYINGIHDTNEFVNAPLILKCIEHLRSDEILDIRNYLQSGYIGTTVTERMGKLLEPLTDYKYKEDFVVSNISNERNRLRCVVSEIKVSLKDIASGIPKKSDDGDKDADLEVGDVFLEDIKISTRSLNCMIRAGIYTVRELLASPPGSLYKIRNFGEGVANELKSKLLELGHSERAIKKAFTRM